MGLVGGFLGGRQELFTKRFLELLHVVLTDPARLVRAAVAWAALERLANALFWAALFALVVHDHRVLAFFAVAGTAVVSGMLGYLAGLQLLLWCARHPRLLEAMWLFLFLVGAGLIAAVGLWWALGADFQQLRAVAAIARRVLVPAAIVAGSIGAALAIRLRRGGGLGAAYRESWLQLRESGESGTRRSSRWPRLLDGAAGALQAKEWVQAARNRTTLLRALVWAGLLAIVIVLGPLLAPSTPPARVAAALGIGLALALFNVGEIAAASFRADGPRLAWLVVAQVRPWKVLAGKLVACLPMPIGAVLSVSAAAFGMRVPFATQPALALVTGVAAIAMAMLVVGAAACGARISDQDAGGESDAIAAILEQLPRGIGAWAGLVLAFAVGAAAVVMTHRSGRPVVSLWLFVPALLVLVGGHGRLRVLLAGGNAR
jgi:hypothetical protein